MSNHATSRRKFRDLSINRKLILVVAIGSAVSALVIGGALFPYQMLNLRNQFKDNLVSVSDVVASYAAAPIAFGDQAGGIEVLSALQSNIDITGAALRLRSGTVFAQFGTAGGHDRGVNERERAEYDGWILHITRSVHVPDQPPAWLVITADFRRVFFAGVKSMGLAVFGVLIVGVLVAVATTTAFRSVIVGPIIRLAGVAGKVAENRDYKLRAEVDGRDEVGQLTATFNDMLSRIEASDLDLRDAYSQLEKESAQREQLQDDLVKTSRMAGMAEVATGVLHNVGNVLNTVNLSVQHVLERLESTRLGHLRQAVGMIQSQNGNLAEFLTSDTRGRAIPDFLSKVTDHLSTENANLRTEMTGLTGHIEHIKEIVSTQQSYARVLGVTELLSPKDIIEDALRLSNDSMGRHNISVVREFEKVPDVLGDRHKTVQILVNLVTNAKDAMIENAPAQRTITVRLENEDEEMVSISIADQGIGIKAEDLPNIFHHGFTTKTNGHGFGLHLSALSAQEMGGYLRVHSDGKDRGAVFTLGIPVARQPQKV